MAGLQIICDRGEDNEIHFSVHVPPRRNGEVNFGALEAINRALLFIRPEAYDPDPPPHHAASAPMPAHVAEMLARHEEDDTPEAALNYDKPLNLPGPDEE